MKGLNILVLSCLLCLFLSVRAQTDTLHLWQRDGKFIDRLADSRAFRMTYVGVPLVAGDSLLKARMTISAISATITFFISTAMPMITCNTFRLPSCWG